MNRLFGEGLFSTMLGVVILCWLAIAIWFERATFDEVSGWFAFATLLLRAKDSLIGITPIEKKD